MNLTCGARTSLICDLESLLHNEERRKGPDLRQGAEHNFLDDACLWPGSQQSPVVSPVPCCVPGPLSVLRQGNEDECT